MARKRRTQSSGFAPTVASRPELSQRDDASTVPTAPESLADGQIWTEPDAMADLAGTDEFVLPPSRSREHWPVLGSGPELDLELDDAAATTKARAPSPGFHEAPTLAQPLVAKAPAFHDARTQLKNPPVQSFFELPTEQLGKIHDEATDLQIAAPEARRPARRPPSSSRIKQPAPAPAPAPASSTGPTKSTRAPRARWPLIVAAVTVGLLVAAAVLVLTLRETPRRLEFGEPLEHGPWRLVLIGAEEGLNTAGKPALRVNLRLGRPGQVMRSSDVQLLLLDARGQAHGPYQLKRLMARAELGQSGLWRAEYRLNSSPPYRLRFAPPGEPVVDFELVMPARPSP